MLTRYSSARRAPSERLKLPLNLGSRPIGAAHLAGEGPPERLPGDGSEPLPLPSAPAGAPEPRSPSSPRSPHRGPQSSEPKPMLRRCEPTTSLSDLGLSALCTEPQSLLELSEPCGAERCDSRLAVSGREAGGKAPASSKCTVQRLKLKQLKL